MPHGRCDTIIGGTQTCLCTAVPRLASGPHSSSRDLDRSIRRQGSQTHFLVFRVACFCRVRGRGCVGFGLVSSGMRYRQPSELLRALHLRQTGNAWSHETLRVRQGSQACRRPFLRRPGAPNAEVDDDSIRLNAMVKFYQNRRPLCLRFTEVGSRTVVRMLFTGRKDSGREPGSVLGARLCALPKTS